jgi:hypothetical protein
MGIFAAVHTYKGWQYWGGDIRRTTIGGWNSIYGSDRFSVVWAWFMFATNGFLTSSIILRVL